MRVAERVRVREIDDDEGRRLLRIVRKGTGSVVTWRRAQMVLLSAQGMPVVKIAEVSFTSDDRVRAVIHNFNADGFDSLYPTYSGGRPKTLTLPERREIKKIAKSKPTEHDLPFSVTEDLPGLHTGEGVLDTGAHLAVGSVVLFLPGKQFALPEFAAVWDDQAGAPVAAVGDHRGPAHGILGSVMRR
jgi:hypothetical protein